MLLPAKEIYYFICITRFNECEVTLCFTPAYGRVINPLKPAFVWILLIFKSLVHTAKKTVLFTVTKIIFLVLLKKLIPVYSDDRLHWK
jgi:hypothetical protein